jgi:hypothetical protein
MAGFFLARPPSSSVPAPAALDSTCPARRVCIHDPCILRRFSMIAIRDSRVLRGELRRIVPESFGTSEKARSFARLTLRSQSIKRPFSEGIPFPIHASCSELPRRKEEPLIYPTPFQMA